MQKEESIIIEYGEQDLRTILSNYLKEKIIEILNEEV